MSWLTAFAKSQRGNHECRSCDLPDAPLGQKQESGGTSGQARGRRGLGKMTRRKREIIGLTNERDFPHLVELTFPPGEAFAVFS
jgi:hypothetical protein